MNVRTFVGKRGEDHFEEIDLEKYQGILTVEMSGSSFKVKGLRFERKEDLQDGKSDIGKVDR